MTGVAENVTEVPAHIVVAVALMETDALTLGDTVMVIVFEVAGDPVAQARLEVMTQLI